MKSGSAQPVMRPMPEFATGPSLKRRVSIHCDARTGIRPVPWLGRVYGTADGGGRVQFFISMRMPWTV